MKMWPPVPCALRSGPNEVSDGEALPLSSLTGMVLPFVSALSGGHLVSTSS